MKIRLMLVGSLCAISFSGLHASNEQIKENLVAINRHVIELRESLTGTEMLLRAAVAKSDSPKVVMILDRMASEIKKDSLSFLKRTQKMREGLLNFLNKTNLLSEVLQEVGIGVGRR